MKTLFLKKEEARDKLARKQHHVQFNVVAYWDLQGTVIAKIWDWQGDYKPVIGKKMVEIKGRKFAAEWVS
jgi:hypothetical protein